MKSRSVIILSLIVLIGTQLVILIHQQNPKQQDKSLQTMELSGWENLSDLHLEINNLLNRTLDKIEREIQLIIFGEKKINADQLLLTSMRIVGDAQYWLKPPSNRDCGLFPRKPRPTNFKGEDINLESLGYPVNVNGVYLEPNGQFETKVEEDEGVFVITGRNEVHNNLVVVKVAGSRSDDISVEIGNLIER
jgi:hypothetical protein